MKTQRTHRRFCKLGTAVMAAVLLASALPGQLWSQCSVINTVVNVSTTFISVQKTLNMAYLCTYVTGMNVSLCAPQGMMTQSMLFASASTGAVSPSCSWTCTGGCGTVTIDSGDGLPVELMGFEIDDQPSAEADLAEPRGSG